MVYAFNNLPMLSNIKKGNGWVKSSESSHFSYKLLSEQNYNPVRSPREYYHLMRTIDN